MPKLDTASIFERLFSTYGAIFTLLVPAALLVYLPVALVAFAAGSAGSVVGIVIAVVAAVLAGVYLQGMAVEAVRDVQDGRRDHTIGSLFGSVAPVIVTLLLAGILTGIIVVIGFVLIVVPGLIALTFLAVVAPAVVIERRGVLEALSRSVELVKGNALRVFGVIVVLFVLNFLVSTALNAVAGDSDAGSAIASLVTNILIAPLQAIATTLVYLDLRRIHGEGGVPADPERPVAGLSG